MPSGWTRALRSTLASGYRPRRVGDPAAPRTGEQARAFQAGAFHRQQVMARGDAGTAHHHDLLRGMRAKQRAPLVGKLHRRLEPTVDQVLCIWSTAGARNVSGGTVEHFILAT